MRVGASKSPLDVRQSVQGIQGSTDSFRSAALRAHPYPLFLEPGGRLCALTRASGSPER